MTKRTTIHLADDVTQRVRDLAPPQGLSRLLNDLLLEWVVKQEQAVIEARMREGYLAVRDERRELNVDWQIVDGESWPS